LAKNSLVTCCGVAVSCRSAILSPCWRCVSLAVPQKDEFLFVFRCSRPCAAIWVLSDLACCILGLFGSKGPFMSVVFCHMGLWYVNSSVLTVGSFAVLYLSKCSLITFFTIWFRARTRVRWVVSDEFMFALVFFHLLRLAPKPLVVVLIVLSLFTTFLCGILGQVDVPPVFFVISFLFCLIDLG
jgi:hypothetical protein